jgi:hypothetical protein
VEKYLLSPTMPRLWLNQNRIHHFWWKIIYFTQYKATGPQAGGRLLLYTMQKPPMLGGFCVASG